MTSDSAPLPRPSSAPEEVVDTAETTKPRQMMRRAVWPMVMVSGLEVNSPISGREANRQMTVPAAMMAALRMRVSLVKLFHTGVLFGTVIVTDEGAHALHNAISGQVEERLELIVDAQNDHIAFGEPGKQAVEEGDQQGRAEPD